MKQLYEFIEVDRNPAERTISVAYYALFDLASHNENIIPVDSARWFSLKNAPKLILDWSIMVEKPIARLRKKGSEQTNGV
jgi:ADP-ribose pyrophosphatase YjhB (NUDIX family)